MAKMKWPKDRKKAFLWAAKAFGTPDGRRTSYQKELMYLGFCHPIERLTKSDEIYGWSKRFWGANEHWWPPRGVPSWTPSCDKERFLFCTLMAALSNKEFEELQA